MQPGKPQGFGTIGEDDTPIFTLPGNPVSSYISFEVFVLPAIRRMMGKLPYRRPLVRAELTEGFSSPAGASSSSAGTSRCRPEGAQVRPVGGHGSHLIGGLAQSNCLIVVAETTTSVAAGDDRRRARARSELLMTDDRRRPAQPASPTSTSPVLPGWSTSRPRT